MNDVADRELVMIATRENHVKGRFLALHSDATQNGATKVEGAVGEFHGDPVTILDDGAGIDWRSGSHLFDKADSDFG
jgi:hypothetical protein